MNTNDSRHERVFVSYRHRTIFIFLTALLLAAIGAATFFGIKTYAFSMVVNANKTPETRYEELSRVESDHATHDDNGYRLFLLDPHLGGKWDDAPHKNLYIKCIDGNKWYLVKLREFSYHKNELGIWSEQTKDIEVMEVGSGSGSYDWFVSPK